MEQIQLHRRNLHRIPELEWDLPQTMAYLKTALSSLPGVILEPVPGALAFWLDFGRESAIAFRADCDALPIAEQTGLPFCSRHPGKMHACGHDGHMAILLELARRLSQKETLPHNVLLIFQPAEESPGGAERICSTGILEEHKVQAIFGLHLWPGLPAGEVFACRGPQMARASELTLDIEGKSSHIARPDRGLDALAAGMAFYQKMRALEASIGEERLLNFGKCAAGTARNAIAAHAHFEGSIRAFRDEVFETMERGLYDIAAQVEADTGCTLRLHLSDGYPAVDNPGALYDRVAAILPLKEPEKCMTAEDYAFYQKRVPGMFFFLGLGDTPPLHADTFDFDEGLLTKGVDLFETLAEEFL